MHTHTHRRTADLRATNPELAPPICGHFPNSRTHISQEGGNNKQTIDASNNTN